MGRQRPEKDLLDPKGPQALHHSGPATRWQAIALRASETARRP